MKKFCVSISRQFGSLGRPVAKRMAEKLDIPFYDRDIVEMAAEKQDLSLHEASKIEETASKFAFMKFPLGLGTTEAQDKLFQTEAKIIREVAERESCVIVGRCSDSILEDFPNHLSIFVYAPYEDRIVNCVNDLGMDPRQAKKMIADVDKARDAYHMRYVKYLPNDMNHIDLMVNSAMFGVEGTAEFLADLVRKKYGE
ncbi:MAG: AAA family ATPase [Acutalibacter sp.]|jgi:cytidylate kinase